MNASVFLSAANADYSVARAVYQFLTDRGLSCFFCDESLLRVGEEKYRSTVDRALANAERVVVVAGDGARAESEWVKYAWQGFASGTVTGGVRGSVVTVLSGGLQRADLPATLRRGHCVSYPAQLEALPRMLEGRNAVPDKPPAFAGTERRTRRFLVLITVCNVLILGAVIWMQQRPGLPVSDDSVSPAATGLAKGGSREPQTGRDPVREQAEAANPKTERESRRAMGNPPGERGSHVSATGGNATAAVADDIAPPAAIGSAKSLWDAPAAGTAFDAYFLGTERTRFCFIPHGKFVMGSPPKETGRGGNEAQHTVIISQGFWLARYECTQAEWQRVMGRNPSAKKGNQFPVETVSWDDITSGPDCFLERMNRRKIVPEGWRFTLPTEAQWEYACRAGTTTPFSFGSVLDRSQANCGGLLADGTKQPGARAGGTVAVGSYPPNAWGLGDMHGNVWEWCADSYTSDFPGGADPLISSGTLRVQRGGSWRSNASLCRSASRQGGDPDTGDDALGFRIAIVRDE